MNSLSKRFKKLKNRKGFTLVELIVVIVIIGILAAILIPRLIGFTDKANATQAVVWAKEVATAMDSYYAEHNDFPDAASAGAIEDMAGVSGGAISDTTNFGDGVFEVTYTKGGKDYIAGRTSSKGAVEDMTTY